MAKIIGQQGVHTVDGIPPIRYAAIEAGLTKVRTSHCNISVHMPRIGCGLAGGDWYIMEHIVQKTLCDYGIEVYVYDFVPAT